MADQIAGSTDRRRTPADTDDDPVRAAVVFRMVTELPRFGLWASAIRDFETPYGKIGLRQLSILWVLRYETIPLDDLSAATLAAFFQVQPSVMTKALTRLESGGLITRSVDPTDSRRHLVSITGPGLEISQYVERLFMADMSDSLARVADVRWDELARALDVLRAVGIDLERKLGESRQPGRQRRRSAGTAGTAGKT